MADQRIFFFKMEELELDVPVIIKRSYSLTPNPSPNEKGLNGEVLAFGEDLGEATQSLQLFSATDLGALLVDGFGDGIWIDAPEIETKVITSTAFGILQATRSRISKTEYISCPSCGRTLFDLMVTTQMIRSRTSHLKGLKIGIMGCIVNGPGEMADADYGYVGSGTDKVTLYRGKEAVKKNITSLNALDELINIIKEDGNWIDNA
jgi:(E)-4-hydroxy-3-methylbut-2-enyl-diphosphate synthase